MKYMLMSVMKARADKGVAPVLDGSTFSKACCIVSRCNSDYAFTLDRQSERTCCIAAKNALENLRGSNDIVWPHVLTPIKTRVMAYCLSTRRNALVF